MSERRALLFAIASQRIAQGVLQWPEPGLIVPPLEESLAEEGLPDLLGAGRADIAFGLMEVEACPLEF